MTKQEIEHNGFRYEVDRLLKVVDSGVNEKEALRYLYPTLPKKSIQPILMKMKRHPYYAARKDLKLSIIEEKGPELQMNLMDIALNGKSERNRLDATTDALDRIYGNAKDDANVPNFTFVFTLGADNAPTPEPKKVIDVDVQPDN